MARNDGIDRTTVRNVNLTRNQIANVQHHNEREKTAYVNPDIVADRVHMNVHYKRPSIGYVEAFEELKTSGVISTRGLKEDAKTYGELIFDVNSAYFHNHGGYEFAKQYYEEAYKAAIEIVGGEEYILSAVMHADERNKAMSEAFGRDIYHYHMHVVYVPVVEKQVKWSKRCKDPSLVGTVKETIMQVSSSKKWSSKPAVDESGKPILQKNGKPVLKKSYSKLQDDYFRHMYEAGYRDIKRGEYGSSEEHLTVTQFKVDKETRRLEALKAAEKETLERVEAAEYRLEELVPMVESAENISRNYSKSVDEVLPEASSFESGRSYRENKAVPAFEKIVSMLQSINRKYHELLNKYYKLVGDYNYLLQRNDALVSRNKALVKENEDLKSYAIDFNRVIKHLGRVSIDTIIGRMKDEEAVQREEKRGMSKQHRSNR